jgi:penicillin V acylase-like amidase (Ntn superfamily)
MDTVSVPRGLSSSRGSGKTTSTVYTSCINAELGEYYFTTCSSRRIRCVDIKRAQLDADTMLVYEMDEEESVVYLN